MSGFSSEVREGFLCPICLQDLGDIFQLQVHVADAHRNGQDERDVVFHLKDFFGKAKQRLLNFDPTAAWSESFPSEPFQTTSIASVERGVELQEPGVKTSHTDYFRRIRDTKIDQFAVDTNKLIIRLDKLISETPSDPSRRKGKLINPAGYDPEQEIGSVVQHSGSSSGSGGGSPARKAEKFLSATLSILKRDGSEVSLGSLLSQEGEDQLRICRECKELLDRRDEQMEQRSQPPHLVQMYERLRSLMNEAGKVFPSYCRMAESLNSGESMYSLEAAKELKLKVMKLQEQIDFVREERERIFSKKIMQFGMHEAPPADESSQKKGPSPRQLLLQRNVRSFAGAFLQEMILSVPNLPSEEEYAQLQIKYKKKLKEQIEAERQVAQMAAQRMMSVPDSQEKAGSESQRTKSVVSAFSVPSGGESEEGWTPDTSAIRPVFLYNPFAEDEPIDPLQQQILIIKGYLKQAAESGRLEEVGMLEQNLKELEAELKEQNVATSPR